MALNRALHALCASFGLLSVCALAQPVPGDALQAKIVAYGSASAFAVLDVQEKLRRVKLTGIDAPEKKQPFAAQAQRLASEYLGRAAVTIVVDLVDAEQRIHGRASVEGRDLGLVLLEAGLAWCDPRDSGHLPAALQVAYAQACDQARVQRRGLWHQPNPTPPWEYRKVPQFDPLPRASADEKHCREIGYGALQCDDGNRYRSVGSTVVGSEGTIYTRRGNTVTGSDGQRYEQRGSTVYGTDGTVCRLRGRQVDCY
jgi:endonuclease YncB( thermonuclease family)